MDGHRSPTLATQSCSPDCRGGRLPDDKQNTHSKWCSGPCCHLPSPALSFSVAEHRNRCLTEITNICPHKLTCVYTDANVHGHTSNTKIQGFIWAGTASARNLQKTYPQHRPLRSLEAKQPPQGPRAPHLAPPFQQPWHPLAHNNRHTLPCSSLHCPAPGCCTPSCISAQSPETIVCVNRAPDVQEANPSHPTLTLLKAP